jgi:hypothetical protein
MRPIVSAIIAGAFFTALASAAFADCSADIAKVEPEIAKISDAAAKAKAEKQLNLAKTRASKKNEKACMRHLSAAKKAAGIK